ncbi:hypothetical protein [Bacillus sp. EAC]|uniref:hypothetical protein n=1 Tax=Bacillus sp. EAC TaxID=1978338 RepID=UPI000B448E78|nr:hypothetical protein [Bacillus sp. EAC]
MDYTKRISRTILIALSLSLFLSFALLFCKQIILSTYFGKIESDNPLSALSLFYITDNHKESKGKELYSWGNNSVTNEKGSIQNKKEKVPNIDRNSFSFSTITKNKTNVSLFVSLLLLLILIIIIYFKKKKKRNLNDKAFKETKQSLSFKNLYNKKTQPVFRTDYPLEEIRKALINWEIQLPPFNQRKSHETIQQWFTRIGKSDEFIPIYEKVRYGNHELKNEEIELVKRFLY